MVAFGIVCILLGLSMIFMQELHWDLHEFLQRSKGLEPQRTSQWEMMQVLTGIFGIVIGILLILIGG